MKSPECKSLGDRPQHHPIFSELASWRGEAPPGFLMDFLGVKTRLKFLERMLANYPNTRRMLAPPLPSFDEEYFEWIDILQAVKLARDQFVMIELGAGYGRWLVRAVAALHQLNRLPFRLIAVEAEPTHYRWLHEHFSDNGIDPSEHELIEAAVNGSGEAVQFHVGNASGWYGQAIAKEHAKLRNNLLIPMITVSRKLQAQFNAQLPDWLAVRTDIIMVRAVMLNGILMRYDRVDLIDLDVQGAEFEVLSAAIDQLNARVKRLHIGTHSTEIEDQLRDLFSSHGWKCVNDYQCLSVNQTPVGPIKFGDGVQTWCNPRV